MAEVGTGACCRLPDGRVWCLPTGKWSWFLSLWRVSLCPWVWLELALCLGGLKAACWLMGGAIFQFIIWPRASQPWWVGPHFSKMATSTGIHTDDYSWDLCLQCPSSQQAKVTPCFPRRSSKNHRQVWLPFLWSLCFVLGPSAHKSLCAPLKSGVSISPSPMELLHTSLTGPQCQMLGGGGSSSQCQIPRCGNLIWGSELSLQWVSLCDTVTFQSMGCPPGEYSVAYIA